MTSRSNIVRLSLASACWRQASSGSSRLPVLHDEGTTEYDAFYQVGKLRVAGQCGLPNRLADTQVVWRHGWAGQRELKHLSRHTGFYCGIGRQVGEHVASVLKFITV